MRGGEHSFIPLQDYFFPRPAQQPTPAPRFRTRLIGDGEEKRGRHVVHKGTSREPFDYSGTLLDSRVQLVWMLSLERLRPTDRPTVSLESIFTSFLDRPINPAEFQSSSRKFYSPSLRADPHFPERNDPRGLIRISNPSSLKASRASSC